MSEEEKRQESKTERAKIPLGQQLFDRPFLLLVGGLVVMFGFYTAWGLYEVWTLPMGKLP